MTREELNRLNQLSPPSAKKRGKADISLPNSKQLNLFVSIALSVVVIVLAFKTERTGEDILWIAIGLGLLNSGVPISTMIERWRVK